MVIIIVTSKKTDNLFILATKYMGADHDPTKLMEDYSRNCKSFCFLKHKEDQLSLYHSKLLDQPVSSSGSTYFDWQRFNSFCRLYGKFCFCVLWPNVYVMMYAKYIVPCCRAI